MTCMPFAPRRRLRRFLAAYALTALAFLALDAAWLTAMADWLYRPAIGHLMRAHSDPLAAAAFYLVYFCGLVFFAVLPAMRVHDAAARGALFGLVAYATYDLTNQATILGWPWHVTLADLGWGTVASACACAATKSVLARFAR
jgi:uncharacterized membrane protein